MQEESESNSSQQSLINSMSANQERYHYEQEQDIQKGKISLQSIHYQQQVLEDIKFDYPQVLVPQTSQNQQYLESMKSVKRGKLDCIYGAEQSFLKQKDHNNQMNHHDSLSIETSARFIIYDLNSRIYRESSLQEVLSLPFQLNAQYNENVKCGATNDSHLVIHMSSVNEQEAAMVLAEYELNPVLLWEVILKQCYEKVFKVDDNTFLYNIQMIREYHSSRKNITKIIHIINKNLLLVINDQGSDEIFFKVMTKYLKFELKQASNQQLDVERNNDEIQKKQTLDMILDSNSTSSETSHASQLVKSYSKKYNLSGTQPLTCQDIIFSVLDTSLRKIEPIIIRFQSEASAINSLSLNLSYSEKFDFIRRSHMAKEAMMSFTQDLENKKIFYDSIKRKISKDEKQCTLLRFLKGRLINCIVMMKKAQGLIQLSTKTYNNNVDNAMNEYQNQLNKIMKGLATITTIFIPYQVVGGIFGMNVEVPWQFVDGLYPFSLLILIMVVVSVSFVMIFRYLQWL